MPVFFKEPTVLNIGQPKNSEIGRHRIFEEKVLGPSRHLSGIGTAKEIQCGLMND
jgi:hypothetical protein